MVNWLTDNIGTGAYLTVVKQNDNTIIVDVRDVVDKDGNTVEAILNKIEEAQNILKQYQKVIICCDYGMSRSNSIAVAVIAQYLSIPFSEAVKSVIKKVSIDGVKPEVLNSVFKALQPNNKSKNDVENILVTGASGFLGKDLIKQLSNQYFVEGITSSDCDLKKDAITLDIIVKEKNITTLVHLANPRIYTLNAAMGDSLTMLKNVLEICRLNNIKLVFISSWEVYSGYVGDNIFINETMPVFPKGAYAETKWLSESLIKHYGNVFGLKYSIIRSSPVYGAGSDKPKFIYNFLDKAIKGEKIVTHQYLNGSPKMDLLYIDDLVNAIQKVIQYDIQDTFNIGSGTSISTESIAQLLVKLTKSTSLVAHNKINSYYPGIIFNTSKAQDILGWLPNGNLEVFFTTIIDSQINN